MNTAAQPKHYQERLVAKGAADAMKGLGIKGLDFYLQTKFTSVTNQGTDRMPYDPSSAMSDQVKASVSSSLKNFTSTTSSCLEFLGPPHTFRHNSANPGSVASHEFARAIGRSQARHLEY